MSTAFSVITTAEIQQRDGPDITIYPTEVTYNTSRYNEAALIEVTGVSTNPLSDVDEVRASQEESDMTIETDADVESQPLVPQATAIFFINDFLVGSGELKSVSVGEEGLVSLTAVDGIKNLMMNTVTRSFSEGVPVQTAIRTVIEDAGIVPALGSEIGQGETFGPGTDALAGETTYNVEIEDSIDEYLNEGGAQTGMAPFITDREFTNVSSLEALGTLCSDVGWYFECDRSNTIQVFPEMTVGYSFGNTEIQEHQAEYILETSAGLQSPPYQRVIVIGGSPRPEDMGEAGPVPRNTPSREPIAAEVGEGRPVFEHTDRSITTNQTAQRVASGMLEEFEAQQKHGELTLVGRPTIRPLDVVTMPDSMGGETYMASSVKHTIDSSDGYRTRIGVSAPFYL